MDIKILGALYRQERKKRDRTIQEIANETGLSVSFISGLETGKFEEIGITALIRLLNVFGYSPEQFFKMAETIENGLKKKRKTAIPTTA